MGFLGLLSLGTGGGGGYLGEVSLVGGVPATEITGLTQNQFVYGAANGHIAQNSGAAFDGVGGAFGRVVSPTAGPSSTQQHTLPATTSDTVALLLATQTIKNKTFTDIVGTFGFDNAGDHTIQPAARSTNGQTGVQLNLYGGPGGPVSGEGGSWHGAGGDGVGTGSGGGAGWDSGAGTGGSSQHTDIGGNNSILNTIGRTGAQTAIVGTFDFTGASWSLNATSTTGNMAATTSMAITAGTSLSLTHGAATGTWSGSAHTLTSTGGNFLVQATSTTGKVQFLCGTSGAIEFYDNSIALRTDMSAAGDWNYRTGFLQLSERTAPGAPDANQVRIYAVDNGGKTEIRALFNTGGAQLIAAQP